MKRGSAASFKGCPATAANAPRPGPLLSFSPFVAHRVAVRVVGPGVSEATDLATAADLFDAIDPLCTEGARVALIESMLSRDGQLALSMAVLVLAGLLGQMNTQTPGASTTALRIMRSKVTEVL